VGFTSQLLIFALLSGPDYQSEWVFCPRNLKRKQSVGDDLHLTAAPQVLGFTRRMPLAVFGH
jgi:hypothetical protein